MKMNNPKAWNVPNNYGTEILKILNKQYKIRTVIKGSTASLIQYKDTQYIINDNGGEFTIEAVNIGNVVNIPYTIFLAPISVATAAYRIAEKLSGKSDREIDWNLQL